MSRTRDYTISDAARVPAARVLKVLKSIPGKYWTVAELEKKLPDQPDILRLLYKLRCGYPRRVHTETARWERWGYR